MRLDHDLIALVVGGLLKKRSTLFLTKDLATADDLGSRFEAAFTDISEREYGLSGAAVDLKLSPKNPSFIKHANGGWVFFYPVDDIMPDEVGGHPDRVFWPSQGLEYYPVTFPHWSRLRLEGHIWYPVSEERPPRESGTAWDRLMEDD